MSSNSAPAPPAASHGAEDQPHPRGLYTLFFTEMWERFSYYGMRALLVLFMVDQVEKGGLGFSDQTATAIYGLYTAAVYLAALPGGWVADRLLGAQRAVWIGGIVIAIGHFVLGVPSLAAFFVGLVLVVVGTGLLKPNISTIVGMLYPEGGARRDAGFTIFYMGINLGGMLGPFVCSTLGEKLNWHYGFTAAGVGMVLGLVQFYFSRGLLGESGREPPQRTATPRRDWLIIGAAMTGLVVVTSLSLLGVLRIDAEWVANRTTWLIVAVAIAYFAWALLFAGLNNIERKRVGVILMLFVASAMFWAGFEQAGSSLNLFAERHTLRMVANFEIPAGWFQSLNSIFVIGLAPLMAALWVALARRQMAVSLTVKVAWGLLLLGLGFVVIAAAARLAIASGGASPEETAVANGRVWPHWLVITYFVHTLGELCLSPVGLSAVTKLAPPRLVGQMMGVWFLATSLGNLLAGLLAGEVSGDNLAAMPSHFSTMAIIAGVTGAILLFIARPIQRLTGGIE
jgi:POT family proton-dependent oligopeptide transporter